MSQNHWILDAMFIEPSPAVDLFRAALCLKSSLLAMDDPMPFPPKLPDLCQEKVCVPDSLFNFLVWTLLGDVGTATDEVSLKQIKLNSGANTCLVLSIAQDLIHTVSRGRTKNTKACHSSPRSKTHQQKQKDCHTTEPLWSRSVSNASLRSGGWNSWRCHSSAEES